MSELPDFPAPAGLDLPPPRRLLDLLAAARPVSAPWLQAASALMTAGGLPPCAREMVVLRTASRMRCSYVLRGHLAVARHAGLSERRAQAALGREGAEPRDLSLLNAVDELLSGGRIRPETLPQLSCCFDRAQTLELVILAGHYAGLSMVCKTFALKPELSDYRLNASCEL